MIEPVQLSLAGPAQPGGAQTLTINLKPAELGRVEVRIERPADGPVKVELTAERPETLLRLIQDQPQLQQALDQAGIPPSGRTIHFSLTADASSGNSFGAGPFGGGASGGGGQRSQQEYGGHGSRDIDAVQPFTARRTQAGLDITA